MDKEYSIDHVIYPDETVGRVFLDGCYYGSYEEELLWFIETSPKGSQQIVIARKKLNELHRRWEERQKALGISPAEASAMLEQSRKFYTW